MMRASMIQLDTHPTPPPPGFFKGRIQKSKYMDCWKNPEDSKAEGDVGDHLRNLKHKRVFGTQRNANVMVKAKIDKKSTRKSQVETNESHKSVKQTVLQEDEENADAEGEPEGIEKAERSQETIGNETEPAEETEVKSKKKKSVGFQEKADEEEPTSASAPRTPVQLSSSLRKPMRSGTPYHTAQNCRRCKIDKLESVSYWLEQIKLAESVGKHFVSAALFHLAHQCNAEPVRNLKMELKRYLSRHDELSNQNEWIEALRNYGLPIPKDDSEEVVDKSHGNIMHSGQYNLKPREEPDAVTCNHEPKSSNTP